MEKTRDATDISRTTAILGYGRHIIRYENIDPQLLGREHTRYSINMNNTTDNTDS